MSDLIQPDEIDADSTVGEVGEAAYYAAALSDPTYHGIDFGRAVDVCSNWARKQDNPGQAFKFADDEFNRVVDEMRA